MAIINNEIVQYKKKSSIRQKIWNYMRRTRQFRLGDVLIICQPSSAYLQKFLAALKNAGYVRYEGPRKPCTNREYVLIKNTGAIAPIATDYGLFDYNTREEIRFLNTEAEAKQQSFIPETIIKILESLVDVDETTKYKLTKKAKITNAALTKWWGRLQKFGVINTDPIYVDKSKMKEWEASRIGNLKRDEKRRRFYRVDKNRAQVVLYEIKNGAYTRLTSELRHLWIKQ